MRILIVEDDEVLMSGLQAGLELNGFGADAVGTCEDAELAVAGGAFDGIVLDLMLPDGSGLDLLKKLRGKGLQSPVLLLTARDAVADRVAGLDSGADDYLGKPFDLAELAARLRAICRRQSGRPTAQLVHAGVCLDPARMCAIRDGVEIRLSRREFTLLLTLMHRPEAVVSKGQLEEKLYGWQEDVESNAIEVHIHHLRAKLGARFIETIRGVGYRLRSVS